MTPPVTDLAPFLADDRLLDALAAGQVPGGAERAVLLLAAWRTEHLRPRLVRSAES